MDNSSYLNPLMSTVAAAPMSTDKKVSGTWFEAMAQAWGQTLDKQASLIQQKSDAISNGDDTPAAITDLTTQSLKMGFLSNSSHTAISSVGSGLETMARKQ
ncbi:MAG TPA: hypothetical protein VFP68_24240 [Burkholderiaceae bacterium]|nr:hypothetical protein [Burkholderiaceae bacterium]